MTVTYLPPICEITFAYSFSAPTADDLASRRGRVTSMRTARRGGRNAVTAARQRRPQSQTPSETSERSAHDAKQKASTTSRVRGRTTERQPPDHPTIIRNQSHSDLGSDPGPRITGLATWPSASDEVLKAGPEGAPVVRAPRSHEHDTFSSIWDRNLLSFKYTPKPLGLAETTSLSPRGWSAFRARRRA